MGGGGNKLVSIHRLSLASEEEIAGGDQAAIVVSFAKDQVGISSGRTLDLEPAFVAL